MSLPARFPIQGGPARQPTSAREWSLCIDFGTAWSKAAFAKRRPDGLAHTDDVRLLQIGRACGAESPLLLPSALFLDGDNVHFGPAARGASERRPDRELIQSFKMLLGADDLERSLGQFMARGFDPDAAFRQRDLIVLYLTYLLGAVRRAIPLAREAGPDLDRMSIRYGHPGWRRRPADDIHATIARLFDEADALDASLGETLSARGALSYADAQAALSKVKTEDLASRVEGPIFEATAAAACHLADPSFAPPFALVIDVGAGTTDIAGFALGRGEEGARWVSEITEARSTISVAGDAVDCALMNLIIEKSGRRRPLAQQSEMWRKLLPDARALKETIFTLRKGAVRISSNTVTVRVADLLGSRDFKEIKHSLASAYRQGLEHVAARAHAEGAKTIGVIATGGGAGLPFLQAIIAKTAPKSAKLRVAPQPLAPSWAAAGPAGRNLAGVFPLVAVAVGGVLAAAPNLSTQICAAAFPKAGPASVFPTD